MKDIEFSRNNRWGLLTGCEDRHVYFAKKMSESGFFRIVGLEQKNQTGLPEHLKEVDQTIENYFRDRKRTEKLLLRSEHLQWPEANFEKVLIPRGRLNDREFFEKFVEAGVDRILVYGTSIIRDIWFNRFQDSMINVHLGISPYYRGSATNFWALHDGRFECFGATVHVLDKGIDSGPILFHVRPDFTYSESPHELGCRLIQKTQVAVSSLLLGDHKLSAKPQWNVEQARDCRRSDFNRAALDHLLKSYQMKLSAYKTNRIGADKAVDLVNEFHPDSPSS